MKAKSSPSVTDVSPRKLIAVPAGSAIVASSCVPSGLRCLLHEGVVVAAERAGVAHHVPGCRMIDVRATLDVVAGETVCRVSGSQVRCSAIRLARQCEDR